MTSSVAKVNKSFSPRRFYAVTSRRYNTLSRCSNSSVGQTMKQNNQQLLQQFIHSDGPTTQMSAHIIQHTDNGDFPVTAAERQRFVLDP